MADFRAGHACDRLEGLLYGCLTVRAHHSFDFHCLCHRILLSLRLQRFLLFQFLLTAVLSQESPVPVKGERILFAFFPVVCILCGAVHLHEVEPERIGDYAEARQTHGEGAEHGIHSDAKRNQKARGNGNEDRVVDQCPEETPQDGLVGLAAQAHCGADIRQAALHQYHIRGVNGDVRAGTDGNADVGPGQGRRIVDAVADHGSLALLLQRLPRPH